MITVLKKTKLYIAISLLVQAFTFIVTAIALYPKKKSLSGTFFAIGLAGAAAGSAVWALHERDAAKQRRLEAVDGCYGTEEDNPFDYEPCEYPDCSVDDAYEFPYVETEDADESEFDSENK